MSPQSLPCGATPPPLSRHAALPPAVPRHNRLRRNLRLFATTDTLDNAMAALATTGDNVHPVNGYSTPAATGMAAAL